MGYRSEVGLVLTRAGVDVLNKKLAGPEVSEETRKEVESLLAYAAYHYTDSESGAEVWLWDWIKWYPDYQDIALLESLMNELELHPHRRGIRRYRGSWRFLGESFRPGTEQKY